MGNHALNRELRLATRGVEQLLASFAPLSAEEVDVVRTSLVDAQNHAGGARIGGASPRIALSGWIGSSIHLPDGRRQIVSLALAGDLLDGQSAPDLEMADMALGAARTADAGPLIALVVQSAEQFPNLALAWERAGNAAKARQTHQLLRLGRLSAFERAASLLLELHDRQQRAGQADLNSMPLPLTQEILADILGLSVVHVNRTLQLLRRDHLVSYSAGRMVFSDLKALAAAAGILPDELP